MLWPLGLIETSGTIYPMIWHLIPGAEEGLNCTDARVESDRKIELFLVQGYKVGSVRNFNPIIRGKGYFLICRTTFFELKAFVFLV